jgi:transposase
MRRAVELKLTKEQAEDLESLRRKHPKNTGLQIRVKIILMANQGKQNKEIADELGISAHKVGRWRKRYSQWGVVGIERGLPRGANHGGKCTDEQQVLRKRVIDETYWKVPGDAERWTARSLAERLETNYSFVHRVWTSLGIRPHHVRTLGELNSTEFQVRLKNYVLAHVSSKCRLFALEVEASESINTFDTSNADHTHQRYSIGPIRQMLDEWRLTVRLERSELPEGLIAQLSE